MTKYKICPACGEKNDPGLFECAFCETDLISVHVTDESTEKQDKNSRVQPAFDGEMIRICDCGCRNPPNARKCLACGEDISDILPVSAADQQEESALTVFTLVSTDGLYAYKICSGAIRVGRESAMADYLATRTYVSRIHASFVVEEGKLYIENLSGTNFTFVNNVKINGKTMLKDGDEIGLGGMELNGKRQSKAAYFIVRER